MSEPSAEQQLAVAEQLQAQLGALEQQREGLREYLGELRRTRQAIVQLQEGTGDGDVLVPLGSGAFAPARLPRLERVLAPLGGGILAEESPDKAIKRIEAREEEVKQAAAQVEENMGRLEGQLASLVASLREAQARSGGEA